MAEPNRGRTLTVFAVLFGILALSNLLKPLHIGGDQTGFVLLGQRLTGVANAIAGPLFGLYLLVYALGIWRMQPYALPMAYAYAAYVILNLTLFSFFGPKPAGTGIGAAIFGVVYAVIAVGVSSAAAYLLSQQKTARHL